jgi:hypothetical protein
VCPRRSLLEEIVYGKSFLQCESERENQRKFYESFLEWKFQNGRKIFHVLHTAMTDVEVIPLMENDDEIGTASAWNNFTRWYIKTSPSHAETFELLLFIALDGKFSPSKKWADFEWIVSKHLLLNLPQHGVLIWLVSNRCERICVMIDERNAQKTKFVVQQD